MARRPHAAARARVIATILSFAAFGVIGRTIDVAASGPIAAASSTTTSTLPSGATTSALSATATTQSTMTTQAVTTTHAS